MKKQTQTSAATLPVVPFWQKHTALLLAVFAFLLFANSIGNGYNMDDELVTRKHRLTSQGIYAIPEIFTSPYYSDNMGYSYEYRPVVLASFAIEHQFFGEKPGVSHFINVFLYILTGFILYKLLQKLFEKYSSWLPIIAVAIFIAHPLHTEVVASIKNRDEILALLGGILAWRFLYDYANGKKIIFLLLGILAFVIGLLSKVTIAPLALLIPLSIVIFSASRPIKILLIGTVLTVPIFILIPLTEPWPYLPAFIAVAILPYLLTLLKEKKYIQIFGVISKYTLMGINKVYVSAVKENSGDRSENEKIFFSIVKDKFSASDLGKTAIVLLVISVLCIAGIALHYEYAVPVTLFVFGLLYFSANEAQKNLIIFLYSILVVYFGIEFDNSLQASLTVNLLICLLLFDIARRTWLTVASLFILLAFLGYSMAFIDIVFLVVGYVSIYFRKRSIWLNILFFILFISYLVLSAFSILDSIYAMNPYLAINSISVILTVALVAFSNRKNIPIYFLLLLAIPLLTFSIVHYNHSKALVQTDTIEIEANNKPFTAISPSTIYSKNRPISYAEVPIDSTTTGDEKLGLSVQVLGFYLQKTIMPYPLGYYYGYAFFKPESVFTIWNIGVLFLYAGLIFVVFFYRNKYPVLSFGVLFYLASILIFSGYLYPVVGIAGDRFTYMSTLGFAIAIAWLFEWIMVKLNKSSIPKILLGTIIVAYSFVTLWRNTLWQNPLRLMGNDIGYLDASAQAHNLYALNLMRESTENLKISGPNRLEMQKEAVIHFDKALQIWPSFFNAAYDKGRAALIIGDYPAAIDGFEKAIAIGPQKGFIDPYIQLSQIYLQFGQTQNYLRLSKKLLAEEEQAEAYNMVARGFYMLGENDSAKIYLHKALVKYPQDVSLRKNLAQIFQMEAQTDSVNYYSK